MLHIDVCVALKHEFVALIDEYLALKDELLALKDEDEELIDEYLALMHEFLALIDEDEELVDEDLALILVEPKFCERTSKMSVRHVSLGKSSKKDRGDRPRTVFRN